MTKPIQKVWTFPSDRNPDVEYQTLQYADGSTSCNCSGWTRRVASDGSRSCKHTRWVDMGTADQHCSASRHYGTAKSPNHHVEKQSESPRLGQRKFAI